MLTERELRERFRAALGEPTTAQSATAFAVRSVIAKPTSGPKPEGGTPSIGAVALALAVAVVATLVSVSVLNHRQLAPRPAVTPAARQSHVVIPKSVSLEQAASDSPDGLLVPTWLPFTNPGPYMVQEALNPSGRASTTTIAYRSHDGRSVVITQSHDPGWLISPPTPNRAGTIGSQPAVFWDFDSSGNPAGVLLDLPDRRSVNIATAGLSTHELLLVAENLHPFVATVTSSPSP